MYIAKQIGTAALRHRIFFSLVCFTHLSLFKECYTLSKLHETTVFRAVIKLSLLFLKFGHLGVRGVLVLLRLVVARNLEQEAAYPVVTQQLVVQDLAVQLNHVILKNIQVCYFDFVLLYTIMKCYLTCNKSIIQNKAFG